MSGKWKVTTAILMALLILATAAVPVFAQTEEENGSSNQSMIRALGIDVPKRALIGNEVTIKVFERGTQEPVSGASVWAVSSDKASEFQNAVTATDAVNATDQDYETMCNLFGEFLGKTNGHGELRHTFNEAGRYLLVATKGHYYPGFSNINIYEKPKALGIRAPKVAQVDTNVLMTVFDRITKDPVQGAGVWAFSRENAETLKNEISNIRAEIKNSAMDYDYESLMNVYGEFLGRTNDDGQLNHAFDEVGEYILVTWKPTYWPGFAHITIKEKRPALNIRAPRVAFVDRAITMTVYVRPGSIDTDTAPVIVEGAGIWAFTTENAEELKVEIEKIKAANETSAQDYNYEALMNIYGEFLGRTDENGQLKHAFAETGDFVLVTWKQGYWPGYARLTVRELPKALGINAPRVAQVHEDVTMKVFRRGTQDPVAQADMWAFSLDQSASLRNSISELKSNTIESLDFEAMASDAGGMYLGQTNSDGELIYSFSDTGKYLLLTFKDGYWPGFNWIKITELQAVEPQIVDELMVIE